MKKHFTTIVLCVLGVATLAAQNRPSIERQVIANAGGYYQTATFSISWTLGEPVIETLFEGKIILTQGFQQPDTLVKITATKEVSSEALGLTIYPNPTSTTVTIQVTKISTLPLQLQFFDSSGKLLNAQQLNDSNTPIDVSILPSGIYFLRFVKTETQESTTVKLQKIK